MPKYRNTANHPHQVGSVIVPPGGVVFLEKAPDPKSETESGFAYAFRAGGEMVQVGDDAAVTAGEPDKLEIPRPQQKPTTNVPLPGEKKAAHKADKDDDEDKKPYARGR